MQWATHVNLKIFALLVLFAVYHFTIVQPQHVHRGLFLSMRVQRQFEDSPSVPDAIAAALGVHAAPGVEQDIVVLVTNYAYADFVVNWLCTSGNVLSLKAVVIAEDPELHEFLSAAGVPSIDGRLFNISASSKDFEYASKGFEVVSNMKTRAVQAVLSMGFNVLFTDADIVFKRDPFLYLRRDVDFEFQTDSGHIEFLPEDNPCTGFFYMRANNKTVPFLERSFDTQRSQQQNVAIILHEMMSSGEAVYIPHSSRAPQLQDTLTFRQLPLLSFPPGDVLYAEDFEQRRSAADVPLVNVHANWIAGSDLKRKKLHEYGLWKVNKTKASCAGQPNCYGKLGKHWLQCALEGEKVVLQ